MLLNMQIASVLHAETVIIWYTFCSIAVKVYSFEMNIEALARNHSCNKKILLFCLRAYNSKLRSKDTQSQRK